MTNPNLADGPRSFCPPSDRDLIRVADIVLQYNNRMSDITRDDLISRINGFVWSSWRNCTYARTMGVVASFFINEIGEIECRLSIDPSIL